MLSAFFSAYAASGRRGQLSIFRYHRVLQKADPLLPGETSLPEFVWQMRLLKRLFNVLPLTEAVARMNRSSLPPRAVCLTFDDGYVNNLEVALPVLRRFQLPATVFVITGTLDGKPMWNDQVIEMLRQYPQPELDLSAFQLGRLSLDGPAQRAAAVPALLEKLKYLHPPRRLGVIEELIEHTATRLPAMMMSAAQVKQLREGGVEIGGHTVHHPILSKVDEVTAWQEIAENKETLESILGEKLQSFAYPNGKPDLDYRALHVGMVRKLDYKLAVSTSWGPCRAGMDCWQLPRMAPSTRSPLHFIGRIWQNAREIPQFAG